MTRLPQHIIDNLVSDRTLGAGNFLFQALAVNPNPEKEYLFLQQPVTGFNKSSYSAFSLSSLSKLTSQWSSFYHREGVCEKDVVAIFLDDTIDYFIHYVALTSIGAVPALLNSKLPPHTAAGFIERVQAVAFLSADERLLETQSELEKLNFQPKLLNLTELCSQAMELELPKVFPFEHYEKDPVLITHTSGTTGIPKAVTAAHQAYLHGVKYRLENPTPNIEHYFTALPHSHNSGIAYLMEATLRGCPVWVQSDKSPQAMARAIENFEADFVIAFPKIFVEMVRAELEPTRMPSVYYWRSTGDAAHERHVREITRWGRHLEGNTEVPGSFYIDGLGSSEMGSSLFTTLHHKDKKNYDRCVGKPQPWVDAQVLDDYGNRLGVGTVGKLGIKSPSLTPGYWNSTGLTEKFRCKGYWITGDLVYRDSQGRFYHVDRITDAINTEAGVVYSLQTEELIMKKFNEIFDCSVYADTDSSGQTRASIRVDLVEYTRDESALLQLLDRVNDWLAENGKASLFSLSVMDNDSQYAPEGVTGKVLKRQLRQLDQAAVSVSC
ncbi:class I adenylate-forming enzyme family protein [Sessilibacter corallicola]|uniref:class I adenylate-forming enzyme family protein n=1 Tax=Sessilibacter corallicola TaxID=2904075 RepID=UPI001E371DDE|nr:class I adenylate-forming enzyme family protein [Sessilibacter corallicola]MCE2028109.1 acyl--CoA ligase [Sessilibacter corallicola]